MRNFKYFRDLSDIGLLQKSAARIQWKEIEEKLDAQDRLRIAEFLSSLSKFELKSITNSEGMDIFLINNYKTISNDNNPRT